MKKIFLILFIMSFLIGSIWAEKNSTIMRIDRSNIQQLPEKPNLNRTYEWYAYAVGSEATHLNWPTPERATFFEMYDHCISYPVTIEQLSHLFYESGDYPWPDSTFHFKIYDADGTTLLHESGDLEAAHYVEYLYTLPTPLVITDDFYVAIVPTDASGHPSSMSTDHHEGHSYTGSAGAWTYYNTYEFITGVYLEGTPTGARISVTPDVYDFGNVALGVPATQVFVIENYCPTGEIIINPAPDLTGDAVFTIISDNGAPYPTTIPTGQTTIEIEVQFTPTAVQAYSTVLSVYDNLTDNITNINITGNGVETDCDWYIIGWDDYGDSWNGGYIDIYSNSVLIDTWTGPAAAGPDTLVFGIYEGETIDIVYTAGGWAYENEYCVYNNFDEEVTCDGLGGVEPAGITGISGTCVVPECPAPTGLLTNEITENSARLNWIIGDVETQWDVIWGFVGFDPDALPPEGTLVLGIIDTTYVLSGLDPATGYDWYVRADCGFRAVSNWVGSSFFTSISNDDCASATAIGEVTDLAFDTNAATISGVVPSCGGSAPYDMWYVYSPSTAGTATFDLCGSDFDTRIAVYDGTCAALNEIGCNDDSDYCDTRSLQSALLDIPVAIGTDYYVQVGGWGEVVGTGDLTITLNTCPDPAALTVTNIAQTTADLGWTEYGTTTTWHIEIDTTGFTPTGIATYTNVSNPYHETGLLLETNYDWYVVSDCGVRDSSNWVGPNTFATLASCPIPTGFILTDITATTADIDWSSMPNADGYNWEVVPEGNAQGVGVVAFDYTTHSEASVTGLTQNTGYDLRAQSICPDRAVSAWSAPFSFSTPCATFSPPFLETFDDAGLPDCWTMTGSENWLFSTGAGYGASSAGDHTPGGGTNYAWIDGSGGIGTNELLTPPIDITSLTAPLLEFYLFSNNTNNPGDNNTLYVDFWDGAAWNTSIYTWSGDNPSWFPVMLDLSTYTITGDVQFRFIVTETAATAFYNDILIDDVTVRDIYTGTDITAYSFPEQTGPATINDVTHTVDIEVAFGTVVTALVATFDLSDGATAYIEDGTRVEVEQVSGVTANDFTSPVTYIVEAEDLTRQNWIVTVTVSTTQSSENDITAYSFPEQTGPATISDVTHTVDIEVAYNADVTTLIATFTLSDLATAYIDDGLDNVGSFSSTSSRAEILQVSGVTVNDFTSPVTYIVEAEDATRQNWIVTVTLGVPPLGEHIDNPFIVGALPYNDTGSTVGLNHDYGPYGDTSGLINLLCTNISYFTTSTLGTSPDAVYEITLASPTQLIIDLCASGYDTAVALVTGDGLDPEDVLLIDDDSYLSGTQGGCAVCCQSYINCGVPVPAGTYYIIVGGYGSNSGAYDLTISAVSAPSAPANVLITNDGTDVTITWDAVTGAFGYIVYSSTDPYGTFTEDTTGSLTGEQWVAPSPLVDTFYHVTAYTGSSDGIGKNKEMPTLSKEEEMILKQAKERNK